MRRSAQSERSQTPEFTTTSGTRNLQMMLPNSFDDYGVDQFTVREKCLDHLKVFSQRVLNIVGVTNDKNPSL